jgi:hypothetical protein
VAAEDAPWYSPEAMDSEMTLRTFTAITLVAMVAVACQREAGANQVAVDRTDQSLSQPAQQKPLPPAVNDTSAAMAGKSQFAESTFNLSIAPRAAVSRGQSGELVISLTAKSPFHVNQEYPHRFKVSATRGLTTPTSTIQRDPIKVTPARLELVVPVTLGANGPFGLDGEMSFSLCTAEKCLMEKRPLTVALDAS